MIAVEGLGYTYPGAAAPTLDGMGFSVATGEIYGLLGPSGAGKSTTQRLLMGLLGGHSGSVEIFGQPAHALGRGLYEKIGVSFELPAVYLRLTALENLKLFAGLYGKQTRDPMEVSGGGRSRGRGEPSRRAVLQGHEDAPQPGAGGFA